MRYLSIILLLFSVSYAADEVETITCATMEANTWSETGGTGCAIMEDASDATYFGAADAGDSAVYTIDDCAYAYTVIDSVVVTWRERCGNTGKEELMYMGVRVVNDTIYPSAYRPVNNTFYDSTRQMSVAPDAGAWTVTDVDAMYLIFVNTNNVGGGNNYVADYTVKVWGTREAGAEDQSTRRRKVISGN